MLSVNVSPRPTPRGLSASSVEMIAGIGPGAGGREAGRELRAPRASRPGRRLGRRGLGRWRTATGARLRPTRGRRLEHAGRPPRRPAAPRVEAASGARRSAAGGGSSRRPDCHAATSAPRSRWSSDRQANAPTVAVASRTSSTAEPAPPSRARRAASIGTRPRPRAATAATPRERDRVQPHDDDPGRDARPARARPRQRVEPGAAAARGPTARDAALRGAGYAPPIGEPRRSSPSSTSRRGPTSAHDRGRRPRAPGPRERTTDATVATMTTTATATTDAAAATVGDRRPAGHERDRGDGGDDRGREPRSAGPRRRPGTMTWATRRATAPRERHRGAPPARGEHGDQREGADARRARAQRHRPRRWTRRPPSGPGAARGSAACRCAARCPWPASRWPTGTRPAAGGTP